MTWKYVVGVVVVAAVVGFVSGRLTCSKDNFVVVKPPIVHVVDTVKVPPKWLLDQVKQMDKELAKKQRVDTQYLAHQELIRDSFPYPVFVKDTTVRFWWPERATFGQKPNDVTTVVTREPRSGQATVLRYATPGPVQSFVADTSPRPKLTFGKFSEPKKHHGILTDIGLVIGGTATGFVTGQALGCLNGQ